MPPFGIVILKTRLIGISARRTLESPSDSIPAFFLFCRRRHPSYLHFGYPTCVRRNFMAMSDEGHPPRLDLESWLARKIRNGHLRRLPAFPAHGGGIIHQPEPYARLLLSAMREPSSDARNADRIRDDVRAFRSWVEESQLDLPATRSNASIPSLRPPAPGV